MNRPSLSGVGSRIEHMSEGGVGLVEREALDAARAEQIAAYQAYYRRLERIAELDRLGVAQ